jgi:hypothetical protein
MFDKVLKCLFLAITFTSAEAQVRSKFQANYDAKPVRFGYYIGFAPTHFNIKHAASFFTPANMNTTDPRGPVYSVSSPSSTAIRAGAMVNYYINDYFDIRFSPLNISVQERKLTYINKDKDVKQDNLNSKAWMEFPLHIKYKSERRHNSRMFIFAGTRWGFETNSITKGKRATADNVSLRTSDLQIEYGVGLEIFREYFKVTPELHFSHGIFNMKRKDNDRYHLNHIQSLKTHSVSLLIMFL